MKSSSACFAILVCYIGFNLAGCTAHPTPERYGNPETCGFREDDACEVSIVTLISRSNDYDGRLVQFVGVLRTSGADGIVYLDPGSALAGITKNGVLLQSIDRVSMHVRTLDCSFVLVTGVFSHRSAETQVRYAGSMAHIERVLPFGKGRIDVPGSLSSECAL